MVSMYGIISVKFPELYVSDKEKMFYSGYRVKPGSGIRSWLHLLMYTDPGKSLKLSLLICKVEIIVLSINLY